MDLKRGICAVFAAGMTVTCSGNAFALTQVSNWALDEVSAAQGASLEPESLAALSATEDITREEFCSVALRLYTTVTSKKVAAGTQSPFSDTQSAEVAAAHELGLMNGRGEGIFDPKGQITRQELCKTLDNLHGVAGLERSQIDPEAMAVYTDHGEVAAWAQDSVTYMLQNEVLRGVSCTQDDETGEAEKVVVISPEGSTTREQALLMGLRFTTAFSSTQQGGNKPDPDDPEAEIPEEETPEEEPDESEPEETPQEEQPPATPPQTEEEKMAFVFGTHGSYFATSQEAEDAMETIVIPVWRLQPDGSKKSDKAYITVNRQLAPVYQAVFQEIYDGKEKFPIRDVGSYAWRPSPTSEHRWGTAIDINADANMEATINADGSLTPTAGTHWTPGDDPYSIPENGDVYNAFTKHGFSWGGNAWRSKRDYMHFSYFGR